MKWERNPNGIMNNELLMPTHSNWWVSFNPNPPIGSEGPETALVVETADGRQYGILLGDWREQYLEAATRDGFGGCLALFQRERQQHEGSWSNFPSEAT